MFLRVTLDGHHHFASDIIVKLPTLLEALKVVWGVPDVNPHFILFIEEDQFSGVAEIGVPVDVLMDGICQS